MGIDNRQYYQEEVEYQRASGGSWTVVTWLIVINVAVFVIDWLLTGNNPPGSVMRELSLRSDLFERPWDFWKLLTYGFAHSPMGSRQYLWHIGLNMYGLWLFGRDVEHRLGSGEFLRFYLATIVVSGFSWLLAEKMFGDLGMLLGASGGVAGVAILYCLIFSQREIYFIFLPNVPVKAWIMGLIFVGLDLLGALGVGDSSVAYVVHLAGAAFAALYYLLRLNFSWMAPAGLTRAMRNLGKPRPNLRVHRAPSGEEDDRREPPQPSKQRQQEHKLAEEADRVLAKLHGQGLDSLNAQEKELLEQYSRQVREKKR